MSLVIADRVRETSTTTGTSSIALAGAVTGYQTFSAGIASGNTTYYGIQNRDVPSEWEVGYGTMTNATTLARTSIISSSNSNGIVTLSAGTKDIYCTNPSETDMLIDPAISQGRLTLTSGTAITTSDVTGALTLYYTPYQGGRIALYDGNKWKLFAFSETSFTLNTQAVLIRTSTGNTVNTSPIVTSISSLTSVVVGALVSGTGIASGTYVKSVDSASQVTLTKNATATNNTVALSFYFSVYDVFGFISGGVLTLEIKEWTNDTTRATTLTTQDNVLVKTGAVTRKYLGTIRYTTTTASEDSEARRFVWNYYNRSGKILIVNDSTATWTYSTAAWQQADANAANKIEVVCGQAGQYIDVEARHFRLATAVGFTFTGIGYDSIIAPVTDKVGQTAYIADYQSLSGSALHATGIGYHFYAWLEYGTGSGTCTWYGSNQHTGLMGSWDC